MQEYIDQLIMDGKTEEACLLIDELWKKEAQAEKAIIANLNQRLDALEKCLKIR